MKLIIQIPCKDEEEQLPQTLADLPRASSRRRRGRVARGRRRLDRRTVEVAREHGVDHIVRLTNNKGLAAAFEAGLDACLKLGADVVVNTDADNQYDARDIPKLVEPIVAGRADMVIGDREVAGIEHFSPVKKRLQRLGSAVVRGRVRDRRARHDVRLPRLQPRGRDLDERRLEVHLHARDDHPGREDARRDRPRADPDQRDAARVALFGSMYEYVRRNALAIFRVYTMYEPLKVFMTAAALLGLVAMAIWGRFAYFYVIEDEGSGHVQSLILGAVLFIAAVQLAALGILGDVLAGSRVTQQRILERVRRVELQLGVEPSHYEPGQEREVLKL